MGRQHNADVFLVRQSADEIENVDSDEGIETGSRLVQDEQRRPVTER
jgi:hypothetical protein